MARLPLTSVSRPLARGDLGGVAAEGGLADVAVEDEVVGRCASGRRRPRRPAARR